MSYSEISCLEVHARRKYHCSWCSEPIEVKMKHIKRAYRFQGEFQYDRMHLECFAAMEKSDHGQISDGWSPGEFNRGEVVR